MKTTYEKILINIPLIFSLWIVYLIIQSLLSEGQEKTDYAFGAAYQCFAFGWLATFYALMVLLFLSINKMSFKDSYMKMALFNLVSPLLAFLLISVT